MMVGPFCRKQTSLKLLSFKIFPKRHRLGSNDLANLPADCCQSFFSSLKMSCITAKHEKPPGSPVFRKVISPPAGQKQSSLTFVLTAESEAKPARIPLFPQSSPDPPARHCVTDYSSYRIYLDRVCASLSGQPC